MILVMVQKNALKLLNKCKLKMNKGDKVKHVNYNCLLEIKSIGECVAVCYELDKEPILKISGKVEHSIIVCKIESLSLSF